ncbi:MAG: amidohydrolase family protein [Clostridia bacterium]|nr:amidohydrolase family protein [Clostridia bacterium]
MKSIQERSDIFKKQMKESDVFDIDLWWDPYFEDGFVTYKDWDKQMADCKARGINGGIITCRDAAFIDYKTGNDLLADLLAKEADKNFYGCMVLVPEVGYADDKGEAYVRDLMAKGFVAARLFPKTYIHSMQEYAIGPILDTLEKLGVPLMLWHTEASWDDMDRICDNHPNLNVIVEGHDRKLLYHARDYVGLMRKHKNFFVENHNLVLFDEYNTLKKMCGVDQLLYGSYFPYNEPNFALYPVAESDLTDEEKANILAGTARKIFPL